MNGYKLSVVIQDFYIKAETEEIAEEQYSRYWGGLNCYYHESAKLENQECDCVVVEEEVSHTTELVRRDV